MLLVELRPSAVRQVVWLRDSIRDHLVKQFMEAHDKAIDAHPANQLTAGRSRRPLFRDKHR
jgi:hypothetical protein